MPKAAFADLWKTVHGNNIWRGFVKNRAKQGGFYWIYATVYPFTSCDGSKGFISCRRKVSQEEKEKYEALYATMKRKEI